MDVRTPAKRPHPSESSEASSPDFTPRVVEVGTHAAPLSNSRTTAREKVKKWRFLARAAQVKEKMDMDLESQQCEDTSNKAISDKLNIVLEKLTKMEESSEKLTEEIRELRLSNENLKLELKKKDEKLAELEERLGEVREAERRTASRLNEMDQYNRRSNIRVFGVKEEKDENCEEVLRGILEKKLDMRLSPYDFEAVHRVGGEGRGNRAIICRFNNRKSAEYALRNKKLMRGTGIGIVEDLTQSNYRLQQRARDTKGLTDSWTRNGTLYVKKDGGEIVKITAEGDLNKIDAANQRGTTINDKRQKVRGRRY